MKCNKCDREFEDGFNFCPLCGAALEGGGTVVMNNSDLKAALEKFKENKNTENTDKKIRKPGEPVMCYDISDKFEKKEVDS